MSLFRRSGSTVTLFHEGKLPGLGDDFLAALEKHRFRTIEQAASEEVSVGWVTVSDPTGDTFSAEDIDLGLALWLRMRVDKKSLPKAWVDIHRSAAERAAGRKLSVRERRELREDLMDKLLPRVLPAVKLVDALLVPEQRQVLLFASGSGAVEAFSKLFFETFGLPLDRADPYRLALRAGLSAELRGQLERASPTPWSDLTTEKGEPRAQPSELEAEA